MIKETARKRKRANAGNVHKAASKNAADISAKVDSLLPPGSPQRKAAGIAAAAGGALLAAAAVGVGPAALAGQSVTSCTARLVEGDVTTSHAWREESAWPISSSSNPTR